MTEDHSSQVSWPREAELIIYKVKQKKDNRKYATDKDLHKQLFDFEIINKIANNKNDMNDHIVVRQVVPVQSEPKIKIKKTIQKLLNTKIIRLIY